MAGGWVKSLQCKSRAFDDVYHPNSKNLLPSSSCRRSSQNIKDVIETTAKKQQKPKNVKQHPKTARKPESGLSPTVRVRHSHGTSDRPVHNPEHSRFPALTELPEGHPSRNVVEIIFHTSWGPKAFTGRVDMIFKVQNGPRNVALFEDYRELVKSRSGSGLGTGRPSEENARCVADGNEVMRFYCLGATSANGGYGAWGFPGVKGSAICTFSGSSGAHESAGGGRGRRAMLVCRVIAGRVSSQIGFDSVSGENGELLVFDPRAVLPCFLIIYKL